MLIDLKSVFTAAKIAKRIEKATPIQTTVMDVLFPGEVRQQHESPVIPVSEIQAVVHCAPMVHRGAESVPIYPDQLDNKYVEPLPVRIHDVVRPVELNNLKLMGGESREAWAARKTEMVRRTARLTAEALCSQAVFNGSISYPLLQAGGSYVNYVVTYNGEIASRTTAANEKWDHADASLATVYNLLDDMDTKLDQAGYGGDKIIWVGRLAWSQLLVLIEATDKPKIPVKVGGDKTINLGGYVLRKMAESYRHPETKATTPKVPDKEIRMVAKGYAAFFYGPVDDLDANLRPLPIFIKPVKLEDPSQLRLVGESKPLPAVSPGATMKAIVMA